MKKQLVFREKSDLDTGVGCTVVIPCYNEEDAIEVTVRQVSEVLAYLESYEIIVVDDGSTDNTRSILEALSSDLGHLRVMLHASNKGYGASLKTGIRRANYEYIVITDADGTYPNDRIPELLKEIEDADMVVGSRTAPTGVEYPFIRKIPKYFLRRYSEWLAGQPIPDMNSGLRVLKKSIVEKYMSVLPDGFSFTTTITLALLTNYYLIKYIPISYSARIGKSKIKPIEDTLKFIQLIVRTGMYFAPLRVFFPFIVVISVSFSISLFYDIFVLQDLTEKTLILLMFTLNTTFFALLADMLDKRIGSD